MLCCLQVCEWSQMNTEGRELKSEIVNNGYLKNKRFILGAIFLFLAFYSLYLTLGYQFVTSKVVEEKNDILNFLDSLDTPKKNSDDEIDYSDDLEFLETLEQPQAKILV